MKVRISDIVNVQITNKRLCQIVMKWNPLTRLASQPNSAIAVLICKGLQSEDH